MIARTDEFKEEIKKLGKQIDFKFELYTNDKIITEDNKFLMTEDNLHLVVEQFDDEEVDEIIQGEDIYNVNVVRKGNLLSTMMKEVDFEIKEDLRIGDIINCSFGLKVNDNYEWINYGKYIIYSKEFNEDTKTYSYVSYDSMLLTMKDVDDVSLIQGVTVKQAIENICEKVGLDVNITTDDTNKYPNLNRTINSEAFNNIEMTYRDVLDMICQALGLSMISDNKTLYLKDIDKGAEETEEAEGSEIHIEHAENEKLKEIKLFGNTEQDGIPTPDEPVDIKVVKNKNKIKVISGSKSNEYEINLRGKNLFNPNDLIVGEYFDASDGSLMEDYDMSYLNYTEVEEDTNYVYSGLKNITVIYYNDNKEFINGQVVPSTMTWYRLRTPLNTKYIRVAFDNTYDYSQAQIEKGDGSPTEFEPYYSIELCKIGDYQDYIYEENGNWYKHSEIGKVVLDGSENWTYVSNGTYFGFLTSATSLNAIPNAEQTLSNNFHLDMNRITDGSYRLGNNTFIQIKYTDIGSSVSNFTNWLSTHNTIIYYPLATPTIEVIEDTTLINQLNNLKNITLFRGTNDIKATSNNMSFYLKLKYVSSYDREEFDAEYLKDKNVKFGKKYMINSVVLSRSEDTDTINRRDEESIALNGVHEFKIKDNLILNFNDREDYIDEIFNQLNGLEYYINDFTSTGITYLEPLDMYNITIDDSTYKCLLLNDEIKINQGLEENIYTEEPEETTTDYKTSGKTDKEVSFIVDKQNANIKAKVSKGEVINEINLDESGAEINAEKISLAGKEIKLTSDDITINSTNFNVDKNGNATCNNLTATNANISGSITSSSISGGTLNGTTITGGSLDINTDIFTNGITVHNSSNNLIIHMAASAITGSQNGTQTFMIAPGGGGSFRKISTRDGVEIGLNGELTCYGNAFIQGSLTVQGSKNRVIDIGNKKVLMNAYETATPYFGDIGSDMTNEKGYCKIDIEEVFSKTIELDNYKVFIQECGEGNLYVEKHDRYFEVLGTPNLKFDWEIKAIQKDYKDTRLDEFKKESDK